MTCEAEKNLKNEIETLKQHYELQLGQANSMVRSLSQSCISSLTLRKQATKQKEANESLEATMHAAATSANKELQSKDRKIHPIVKKVSYKDDSIYIIPS